MKTDQPKTENPAPVSSTPLLARELEMQQVMLAISKTEAAQVRAMETLDALYDKKCRQMAELRFQRMLLAFEKQRLAQAG
jgi:hypothetical protein